MGHELKPFTAQLSNDISSPGGRLHCHSHNCWELQEKLLFPTTATKPGTSGDLDLFRTTTDLTMTSTDNKSEQVRPRRFDLPFKVAGVKSDLDEHGAARVQVVSFYGDPRPSRQGPRGRLHAGEIRRLERKTDQSWLLDEEKESKQGRLEGNKSCWPRRWRPCWRRLCSPGGCSLWRTPRPEPPAPGNPWRRSVDTRSWKKKKAVHRWAPLPQQSEFGNTFQRFRVSEH